MKRIGQTIKDSALRAALGDLEASRKARKGKAPASPQETQGRPSGAGGAIRDLERTRAALRLAKAAQLQSLAREAGLSSEAAAQLADGLRAQAPNGWTFLMLSPSQNGAVVRWIVANSSRPLVASSLWARLFELVRNDTGEIMASRSELAAHLGVTPDHVSQLMGELASINAVRRERSGRAVRYYMNSNVATHLPGPAAREAARGADGPLLVVVPGGKAPAPRSPS